MQGTQSSSAYDFGLYDSNPLLWEEKMLESSPMSQCLDRRSKIFGFEMFDLFVIFFTMACLNYIFSQFNYRFFFVWVPTVFLTIILRIVKVGKPDNYLKHLAIFHFTPRSLGAFPLCRTDSALKGRKIVRRKL